MENHQDKLNTMKKTIIIIDIISTFIVGLAQAQEVYHDDSFELNNPLPSNQNVEYKANDFILLGRGFLSAPQSPNYTMLEIDPFFNPQTPYGVTNWEPEDCSIQGRLGFYPMDFDVNENGAAVISMPLEFPEGINGMTPHLSLNYNSQGGNGIMGLGWSLGGMSKISRVPYTYMYDDSCHAVKFSNLDELALDGVVLRKGSKDGKVCYYPEIYDYSIVYPINSEGNYDNGFRVLKRDGNVYTYDAKYYLQSQISTPIEWHLSRVEDPFGNYIEYEYKNDRSDGAFYPNVIRYTGHNGQSPKYEIRFEYAQNDRNDCPPKYFSQPVIHNTNIGFSRITKQLEGIQCWYDNNRLMSYQLSYITLDWNIRALSYVEKSFYDYYGAKTSYNIVIPTEFQWEGTNYQIQFETAAEGVSLNANYNYTNQWYQYTAFAARFERNGIEGLPKYEHDIVHLMQKGEEHTHNYYLTVLHGDNEIGQEAQRYRYNEGEGTYDCSSFNVSNGVFSDGREILAFMPTDTDGDGLNEIMCASYYTTGRVDVSLIKPNSSKVFYEETIIPSLSCSHLTDFTDFSIGDFNGDGLSDLFFMYYNQPIVYVSAYGNPFSEQVVYNYSYNSNRKIIIGDFDGDKKDQIIVIGKQSSGNQTCYADYLRINEVFDNSGAHFGFASSKPVLIDIPESYFNSSNKCYRLCLGDFNGDSKTDIVLLCEYNWRFYFSQGNGAFKDVMINYDCYNDEFVTTMESNTESPSFAIVSDFDNDGCDDIGVFKVKNIYYDKLYKCIYRRDFLIRHTNNSVQIRKIRNIKPQSGNDICIDSLVREGDYYAAFNPFIPIIGNHKGTAPNEIMTCRMGWRSGTNNLGVFMHNSGCLNTPPNRAINKIVTSLGATTEIEYRPVSYQFLQEESFGRENDEPNENDRDLTPVLPFNGYLNIVETVLTETEDVGANSNSQKSFCMTRYHFTRPYYHTRGRGFLGFNWIWSRRQAQNASDDIITRKDYSLNSTYSIMVPERSISSHFRSDLNLSLDIYEETSFTYNFHTNVEFNNALGQIPNNVFSPYLEVAVTKRNAGEPILYEKEVFDKDGYGNIVTQEHRYGTSESSFPFYEKRIMTYDDNPAANRWILGVPKTETMTQHLFGNASNVVARHVSYLNDMNTGQHNEKDTEPGNEKQLTETYEYDDFGNLISTKSVGSGITRTESVIYSEDGRFPKTQINALGQRTTCVFDEPTGRTKSFTDPNGLTTNYYYDILGNLIQTEYPSGILEDQTIKWVGHPQNQAYHPDTPDFGSPVYFIYSKRSGERESYVFYDQLNRKLREVRYNMAGDKIFVDYKYYNISGLLQSVSNPYIAEGTETTLWTNYYYDYLDRTIRIERPDNNTMIYSYLGENSSVIDFDGRKTTLKYTKTGLIEMALRLEGNTNNAVATTYTYYGDGKLKEAKPYFSDALKIVHNYDVNRNPLSVIDPSLGELTYNYNAFGELVESTSPRNATSYVYDALGRMIQRCDNDGDSYWKYDNDFIGSLSQTKYVPTNGTIVQESYKYDRFGNLKQQTQIVGNEESWTFNYTYNSLGKQSSITYPSGKKVNYHYNNKGFMDYVKDAVTGDVLWQATASDQWDNISGFTEGNIDVEYIYDPITGLINNIEATQNNQIILDQSYHWTTTGNLEWRTDATLDLKERFGYDGYNRLTSANVMNMAENHTYSYQSFDYDNIGNISHKTGVGGYSYGSNASSYAVTGLQPEVGQEALFTHQEASYTSFDKLLTLEQGGKILRVDYGVDRQRVRQTLNDGNTTRTKRYFSPLYESITENGVTKNVHYLTSSTGLFAIFATQSNGGNTMHYTLKDHQGNLTATVCDNTVERLSYDAWGRRRNPIDFGYDNVTTTFDRGYTLHEHYDDFNLINMNGRLYDPVLGRMLSPDIAIQDEHNALSYNRYSYCFNNPLRFTDPSGYVVTIPPEFNNYYLPQYFDDFEAYKSELAKLGVDANYETKELEGGGGTITNLWWKIGEDFYKMIIVDHKLKDYQQRFKMSCVASSLAGQEQRLKGNIKLTEEYFMGKTKGSDTEGLNTSKELEDYKSTSYVYSDYSYFKAVKANDYYEGYTFSEMSNNNGVLFRFYDDLLDKNNQIINHTMNASIAISFSINNGPEKHEVVVWDSDFINGNVGGYRSFLEFASHFYYKMGILWKK